MSGSFFGRPEHEPWVIDKKEPLRRFQIIGNEHGLEFVDSLEASYIQLSDQWVCFYIEVPGGKDFMVATFNADLVARVYEEPREGEGK